MRTLEEYENAVDKIDKEAALLDIKALANALILIGNFDEAANTIGGKGLCDVIYTLADKIYKNAQSIEKALDLA